jgi:hypothetical protein
MRGGSRLEFGVRDSAKVQIIDRYFANHYDWLGPYEPIGSILVSEVRQFNSKRINVARIAALAEKESGARNIFGCDWGPSWTEEPPYCRVPVTQDRVVALLLNIEEGGGQNGVGVPQLTMKDFVIEANREGGAHVVRYQLRVAIRFLDSLLSRYDYLNAIEAYNDGNGRSNNPDNPYDVDFARLERHWKNRLSRVTAPDAPTKDVMAVIGQQRGGKQ